MPVLSALEWSAFLANHSGAHLLQTTAWGELKSAYGWEAVRVVEQEDGEAAGAQLLFRRLTPGFSWAYLPKGPLPGMEPSGRREQLYLRWERLWPEVDRLCRARRCVFLKVEPDLWGEGTSQPNPPPGFRPSPHSVQPPRTILVDLQGKEEHILGRMKQKTRYNIRLAQKKGVVVRPTDDLETFYRLMRATGARDRFGVHSLDYYQAIYRLFQPRGECELLLAEYEEEPLAALMVFARGARAWYFYGASGEAHRERMPSYLLQWEAMRWARARGCTVYDLWGVPDADEHDLEAHLTARSDGLWGVYRFKRGFGGQVCRAVGPWDRVYLPAAYRFYLWWVGRGLRGQG